ncbi:hypothetical protein THIOM_000109 [Candidatus Thiomargarita nelsonii]|uniref:Uncharacterized protein n=1 Tax=Candidatus Thiomargarita nelsonii TaxID=1003181 RepID=A0A176S7F0_9GAMM|nr:hypothetical protein THIOM_000109 [Candidatus Thiomargarita nelsonii]
MIALEYVKAIEIVKSKATMRVGAYSYRRVSLTRFCLFPCADVVCLAFMFFVIAFYTMPFAIKS